MSDVTREQLDTLKRENNALRRNNERLTRENAALQARVERLNTDLISTTTMANHYKALAENRKQRLAAAQETNTGKDT